MKQLGAKQAVLGALMIAFMFNSCGYSSKTVLPVDMKTIYVDTVKNQIPIDKLYAYQPGIEIQITNAIIRRLHVDGNLTVTDREEADVILEPILIGYEQEGVRFSRLETVQEFRLYIVLAMRLIDSQTGDILWEEANFSGDADYFVSKVRSISQAEATERAIDRLARNVVDRIVEDW